MTNLVKMLDALDTAVTEEEVLAIESKLIKLYQPSFPKFDRVTSDRTGNPRPDRDDRDRCAIE